MTCTVCVYPHEISYLHFLHAEEVCFVTPKEGTALVFNHDTLHEGLPVSNGVKYIIRTEIMYHRVDREMIPDPMSYQRDENYLATLALYQKSWRLEQGNCLSECYVVLLDTMEYEQFCHCVYMSTYMYMYTLICVQTRSFTCVHVYVQRSLYIPSYTVAYTRFTLL